MSPKRNQKTKKLPLETLKTKARPVLNSTALVGIAATAHSPTEAYELAYLETGDVSSAKACRFAAMIKRDHGKKPFAEFSSAVVSQSPRYDSQGQIKKPAIPKTRESAHRRKQMNNAITKDQEQATQVSVPVIPLKHINYRTTVNGAHARVRSIMEYVNDATVPVEAVYVFPLPDEASVTGCKMQIGERKIAAELKERAQAKKEYDDAIASGHHGALLEQERPNIFTMNVGGIEPGEAISAETDYVQRIPWQQGGRFTIPLVVAPRFIPGNPTGKQGGGWSQDTDQVPDASRITPVVSCEGVPYDAGISISFSPGFECKLTSPSHPQLVTEQIVGADQTIEITLGNIITDRDFIIAYEALTEKPEVAHHFLQTKDEAFSLITLVPPYSVKPSPADIIFLLDISGSMQGPKIEGLKMIAKKILRKIKDVQPDHRVSVILFNSYQKILTSFSKITDEVINQIDTIKASSGTRLGEALTLAHRQFTDSERAKVILLITDAETEDTDYIGSGARIMSIGVDSAINDTLLKDLARNTGGSSEWFFPGENFDRATNSACAMLSGPVWREVKIDGSHEAYGLQDVFQNRPATIAVRFTDEIPDQIRITGLTSDGKTKECYITPRNGKECRFADRIWAREAIRENQDAKQQLTTSLKYGVICGQTAFVAISEKEVPGQKPIRVEIPVELPFTWDYAAIFGQSQPQFGGRQQRSKRGAMRCGSSNLYAKAVQSSIQSSRCYVEDMLCGLGSNENINSAISQSDFINEMSFENAELETISKSRFILDADDLVDQMIAILIAIASGDRSKAETAFKTLELDLVAKLSLIESWSEEKCAMAYYFAMRLIAFRFTLDKDILLALKSRAFTSDAALAWHNLAQKEIGSKPDKRYAQKANDGQAYVFWKFGFGNKPSQEPWSLVP
ncbi:MAG: VIT domain-containing protein [bacterium]|nr:VIT domain-containing protein [bacterium]